MRKLPEPSRASALQMLGAVGIDNLLDDCIKPRQPLDPSQPNRKLKLSQDDTTILPLNEYDDPLLQSLNALVKATDPGDYDQIKEDLLVEVRTRHRLPHHPVKNYREVLGADVWNVLAKYEESPQGQSYPMRKRVHHGQRKRKRKSTNNIQEPRQLRPGVKAGFPEERGGEDDADLNDVNTREEIESQDEPNEPDGRPIRHEHSQTQNDLGETMRVTVFYPIRETAEAQDEDTSFSLEDILSLANSAGDISHRTTANTRVNVKVLPIKFTDAAAADAGFEKANKLIKSLTHLQNFAPMAEEVMQVPTRKRPEVQLMAAMSEAWDTARQTMHEAASLHEEDNDAELHRAREAHAQYERAEFEWRRNMMARLAQMQLKNATATSGLVISPKLKELFEPVLL